MIEVRDAITSAQVEAERRIINTDSHDLTISETSEALLRQAHRARVLDPENDYDNGPGIHLMPRWQRYTLLRVGQKRGPADLQTRGQSAHGVAFGVAQIRTPDGDTPIIKVAIKPYRPEPENPFDQEAPRKALFEARVNAVVLARDISTTDPICVVVDGRSAYIITPVKEGVQTLDTEPWHQFFGAHPRVRKHFTNRLGMVGESLAVEHFKGVKQGDVQLRNFWMCPGNGIEPFDWESAEIFPLPITPASLETCARSDLERFFSILDKDEGRKILTGHPAARRAQFREWVTDSYNDALETLLLSSDASDDLLHAASIIRGLF